MTQIKSSSEIAFGLVLHLLIVLIFSIEALGYTMLAAGVLHLVLTLYVERRGANR